LFDPDLPPAPPAMPASRKQSSKGLHFFRREVGNQELCINYVSTKNKVTQCMISIIKNCLYFSLSNLPGLPSKRLTEHLFEKPLKAVLSLSKSTLTAHK
jgi:hypothetical protein